MRFALPRLQRAVNALIHDIVMAALSFAIAISLRMGPDGLLPVNESLVLALGLFTAVSAGVFWFMGLYRGIWRYASLNDVIAIVKAVTLAILVFSVVTFMVTRLEAVPRSALVINWFVLIALLSAPRMLYRVVKDHGVGHILEPGSQSRVPVLVIGVDDIAETFVRAMARDANAAYEVLGLVDPTNNRIGRQVRGVPVIGGLEELPALLDRVTRRERPPQRLVLTKSLERARMEALLDLADSRGMTIARLPRVADLQSGGKAATGALAAPLEVKPIAIEDLLSRPQTKLDRGAMSRLIAGRRVLVTGAGGSIGAELVRQVAALAPTRLVLLDSSEFNLYAIDQELERREPELPRRAVLGDVRDRSRLDSLLARERPELVFHAAAYKHVPMVEANPVEGVLTNVFGTRNMADACLAAGVDTMVLISTDKAINPPNVMGATKRLAETYCQALDLMQRRRGDGAPESREPGAARATRFVTLRFGNVLGSTGSVVPLFQRQLAEGGPLTVTDPEVQRYFMTVREAVELVLQGAALSIGSPLDDAGKIYVLDMGQPVKIVDLARQMIRLAGLRPGHDVDIVFTGLRPGEKLNEELFHAKEPMLQTPHPGLKLAAPRTANHELLKRGLDELAEKARDRDKAGVLALLKRLVPEYQAASAAPEAPRPLPARDSESAGRGAS